MKLLNTLLVSSLLCLTALNSWSQSNIRYGENFIVFEAEDTDSPLGKWALRTPEDPKYYGGTDIAPINNTYIEFVGAWASKESPLTYKFTCPKTGDYRLVMRMYQPLTEGEKGDQKNDVFIRMEGNYTSATSRPKSDLEDDHKFWGRGVRQWGACYSLEMGGNHLHARYGLVEGEEYTLVMSGRSPGTSLDYIVLFEDPNWKNIGNSDLATQLPTDHRPFNLNDGLHILPNDIKEMRQGDGLQFSVKMQPSVEDLSVLWKSSNDEVLTVDQNGYVQAVGAVNETAEIIAIESGGEKDTLEIKITEWVPILVDQIATDQKDVVMYMGERRTVDYNISPIDADDKSITWSVDDATVATIDEQGEIKAENTGFTKVRISSNDGNAEVTLNVVVKRFNSPQNITWSSSTLESEEDVIANGELVEAINFSGNSNANEGTTVINGVSFEGFANGNETNVWATPITSHFYSSSSQVVPKSNDIYDTAVGLEEYDVLLSSFLWDGKEDPTLIGLRGLEVGANYAIQLFSADTRESEVGAYLTIDDSFGSLNETAYGGGNGISILGTFKAEDSAVFFEINKMLNGKKSGINLNGYQLRKVPDVIASLERDLSKNYMRLLSNPSQGMVAIAFDKNVLGGALSIYDMKGIIVHQSEVEGRNKTIDLTRLQKGIYVVKLVSDNSFITKKLILN